MKQVRVLFPVLCSGSAGRNDLEGVDLRILDLVREGDVEFAVLDLHLDGLT